MKLPSVRLKEFLIVLGLVAVLVTFYKQAAEEMPGPSTTPTVSMGIPSPSPSPIFLHADARLELQVEGRPKSLEDLKIQAKMVSPEPVYLSLRKGRPLGYLNIGNDRYSLDFVDRDLVDQWGRVPNVDPSKLTDEEKKVTEYEWEIRGTDLVCSSENSGRIVDGYFRDENEIKLWTFVFARPRNPENERKLLFGEAILPALE